MLSAPRTWGEYARVVKTINERADEIRPLLQIDNADRALIAEPYADDWAAKSFLARAAAYARNRSQYSCLFSIQVFEPQIDGAPFVRSLDELRAISNEVSDSFPFETPYEIAARFAAGELAMAVTWPESLRMVQQQNTSRNLNASVTSMPGANEYFDKSSAKWQPRGETESPYVPLLGITGRCVGIGRRSASVDRAYDFILWLTDPQNSARTAGLSSDTTIARNSQTSSIATLLPSTFSSLAPSLAETVQQDQSRELSLTVLRVPGHDRYLQTLSTAIRQSLKSSETSQHILQGVRAEWSKITEELGKDKQVQAYAESLGINP
jgi:multiple sugar transport system substrate-binding protein